MCCIKQGVKLFCLGIASKTLARVGGILHRNLDRLNSLWYRFSVYCLVQVARWPNQTTGELVRVTYLGAMRASVRETWV